jgi:hypothetical protein
MVSVAAFIGHSIVGDRAAGRGAKHARHPARGHGSTSAVAEGEYPEPGRMLAFASPPVATLLGERAEF